MYGLVKFVGPVAGKQGIFAGVQLAAEFVVRGKNSGDVDGRFYFRTTVPGSGIFLPGGRASLSTAAKPSFSQSLGPSALRAGAASPSLKPNMARRESLARPTSPMRKTTATPSAPAPPAAGRAKLRSTATSLNTPKARPSFRPRQAQRPVADPRENRKHEAEKQRLQKMLEEKDRALQEQGLSISEMEKNLIELQKLMPGLGDGGLSGSARSSLPTESDAADEDLPRDVVSLRAVLREKNEKIKLLTAEFDANRADFRSTIDTLEMASNETERVYEKRVDELLDEVRHLQDRAEDVDTVAQQLRQLEDLVQELEEGLEDARRGEAEARAEVEFLRGERLDELQAELESKEDEIRGLKVIIHNLNSSAHDSSASSELKAAKANGFHRQQASVNESAEETTAALQKQVHDLESLLQLKSAKEEELEHEVSQLRNSVHLAKFPMPGSTSFGLRTGGGGAAHSRPASDDLRKNALKHASSDTQASQSTVVLSPTSERKQFHDGPPSEAASTSSAVLWCEICEDSSHDILSCSNMISSSSPSAASPSKSHVRQKHVSHSQHPSIDRPAPLVSRKSNTSINSNPGEQQQQRQLKAPIEGTGDQAGMWAGKSSGVINPDKWCALCERDGHDSVDCPIEDAF
ncbi:hypothetical protein DV737_g1636, partial [Chaetothyriales sp. CBS 132003]